MRSDTGAVTVAAGSPFLDRTRWVNENDSAVAIRDLFPVSRGHTLVVPKRVVSSLFDLSEQEVLDCWRLLKEERQRLESEFSPDGFNIGMNVGEAAGQTVPHAHIHLIPRYAGDVPSPRGGVRGVIPGKASY
ncbi:MAG: HIT family protein [Candidatus Binatia bacterium]|jgi:diadenosine tetraphosphate (Ap4A) HIT family hydrolase